MTSTEFWLTPLILLPGVALLIGSTSARFGQIHTEFHHLLDHPDAGAQILSRNLQQRARLFRDAKLMEIGAGTSEIRRMLVGRELMGAV